MANKIKFPATLQSKLLGELNFDEDSVGYAPANRDPYSHVPGRPYFFAKLSEDNSFEASEFLLELDRTWESLFAKLETILIDSAVLFAEKLESYEIEPVKAKEIATTITGPDRLRMVRLNMTGDFDGSSHHLVFVCKDFYSEAAGQDAIVSLSESFEPESVRFDG
jgi:hypothetical protein